MLDRYFPFGLLALALLSGPAANAQGLRAPDSPMTLTPLAATAPARSSNAADFIVAVVNSEPITNHEVRRQLERVVQNLPPSAAPPLTWPCWRRKCWTI